MEYEECLIKIKLLLNNFYQSIGRGKYETHSFDDSKAELIAEIDDLISKVKLDNKKMIIAKMDGDDDGELG